MLFVAHFVFCLMFFFFVRAANKRKVTHGKTDRVFYIFSGLLRYSGSCWSYVKDLYCVVWRKQKSLIGNQNHVLREARFAKTLFLITGTSILTWLPFQILNLLAHFGLIRYFSFINATIYIVKFLQFSNSLVNVIIYPFRISEFKNALLQMFHCCVILCQRGIGNEVVPIHPVRVGQLHPCQELQVTND